MVEDIDKALDPNSIEALYQRLEGLGEKEILDRGPNSDQIRTAFLGTVETIKGLTGSGPFHPVGTRKALFDLREDAGDFAGFVLRTEHLQALLWSPPTWSVEGRPDLDFVFVAREVCPASGVVGSKRSWLIKKDRRVSADLLLMNAKDRTPIVAEFKRGNDRDADYALVQALAAAAQLTPKSQRARLRSEYSDFFGAKLPELLDVYVILADPPPRGVRPKLLERALSHAAELTRSGRLDQWIRRIVILEATAHEGGLAFEVVKPKEP